MTSLLVATLLSFACHVLSSSFIPAPQDLKEVMGFAGIPVRYKEVPTGICEQDPNVKSYSGYLDVGENEHLFFWFFEARAVDPTEAPLTVWINGGPGSSSMIGLFQELGPCRIDRHGNAFNNPYSWTNASNVVFIDQPVTVGNSYSKPVPGYYTSELIQLPNNTCPDYLSAGTVCSTYSYANASLTANSTLNAAPNMWKALQGFMGAFPQYSRDGFHFTTESYGGHYGPVFNEYFLQQNAKFIPDAKKINLKSVNIGNGWYNPLIQYQAYYNFTVFPGNTYDFAPFTPEVEQKMYNNMYGEGNCFDQIRYCHQVKRNDVCSYADHFCAVEVEFLLDSLRDEYDIRETNTDPFPPSYFEDYLNTPKVREAIGSYVSYSAFSPLVGKTFGNTGDDGRIMLTIHDVKSLLSQGINVMLYAGDADYNCNWIGGEAVADSMKVPGWSEAGYTNISSADGNVYGQVKQSGKFSFVRIYESGHEVPFYQPVVALEIFQRSMQNLDIETGTTKVTTSYKTTGTKRSTYREGPATIQHRNIPSTWVYNTKTNQPEPPNAEKIRKRLNEELSKVKGGPGVRSHLRRKLRREILNEMREE